jgi:hypothetical protein
MGMVIPLKSSGTCLLIQSESPWHPLCEGLKPDLDLIKLGHKLYIKSLKKRSSSGMFFLLKY